MRLAFIDTLFLLAKKDRRITLLTGDLGYSVFESYKSELPLQYLNCGVSEQNMTGVAAGMAMEGKIPFIYSIIPFATMRNFEQIRDDICYQRLNVKIVGVGSGYSYGTYGRTHYALEDIGILRTLPNLTIFSPGDPVEARYCTELALRIKGPVYIRLGRSGEPTINEKSIPVFGRGTIISEGNDFTIITAGNIMHLAKKVVDDLRKIGLSGRLVSMFTIKPIDEKLIISSAKSSKALFTIEEHSIIGGLGSAVAEIIADNQLNIPFKRFGTPDIFDKLAGNQQFMRERVGLSDKKIVRVIKKILSQTSVTS